MTTRYRCTPAEGQAQRDALLCLAVQLGWAAKVRARALAVKCSPALLVLIGTGCDASDRLRQDLIDHGADRQKLAKRRSQQREPGEPEADLVLWPHDRLLRDGPAMLPPEEMAIVHRRLADPEWATILAVGGGGASVLCLPYGIVLTCGDEATDILQRVAEDAAEGGYDA